MTLTLTFTLIGVCRVVTGLVGLGLIASSLALLTDDAPLIASALVFCLGVFLVYAGCLA